MELLHLKYVNVKCYHYYLKNKHNISGRIFMSKNKTLITLGREYLHQKYQHQYELLL